MDEASIGREISGDEWDAAIDDVVAEIATHLIARGETVSVAESAAGGRACDLLSNRPGSSAWFAGGIVAYSNAAKQNVAGVDPTLLGEAGAVSVEVALAMAHEIRQRFGTTWGVGETGIAGPQMTRRSRKPTGLVHLAVAGPNGAVWTRSLETSRDDRLYNKGAFARALLRLLRAALHEAK